MNLYCDILRVQVPQLEALVGHPEAKPFGLLLATLLERGAPMTLEAVAARLAAAGAGKRAQILAALRRCRPGRPPVYRVGGHYSLDPYDDELDLWTMRLELRAPPVPHITVVRDPLPVQADATVRLTIEELRTAWGDYYLANWTAQRVALAVLDVHGPLSPEQVVARATQINPEHRLAPDSRLGRRGAVVVGPDGRWSAQAEHPALLGARRAVRARIAAVHASAERGHDPAVARAYQHAQERRRAAHASYLAGLKRAVVHGFPPEAPQTVVVLDPQARHVKTFHGPALAEVQTELAGYDVLAGLDIRTLLEGLTISYEGLRLAELHPFHKGRQVSDAGDAVPMTPALLIRHTCRIPHPLGTPAKLRGYVSAQRWTALQRRLEADAKALYAYYLYGRTHGCVRLRWSHVDEFLPVPWVHRDEPVLESLLRSADSACAVVEVVAGAAPSWDTPWDRARRCHVHSTGPYHYVLVSEDGRDVIDPDDVHLIRYAQRSWAR